MEREGRGEGKFWSREGLVTRSAINERTLLECQSAPFTSPLRRRCVERSYSLALLFCQTLNFKAHFILQTDVFKIFCNQKYLIAQTSFQIRIKYIQ